MGCGGEKRSAHFDGGGLIEKGKGFGGSLRPGCKGGEKRRRGGEGGFALHSTPCQPGAPLSCSGSSACSALLGRGVRLSARPPTPGRPQGLCSCARVPLRQEWDWFPHPAPAPPPPHTHSCTIRGFFVQCISWHLVLSKQSRHMPHFLDRWFRPGAT